MQDTEDNSQSNSEDKRPAKQQSTAHRHAKTLKQTKEQADGKGKTPRKKVTQMGHSGARPQNALPAKTMPQQSRSVPLDSAAAHPQTDDMAEVNGPPSIPAAAKVHTATLNDFAGDMPNPTTESPPTDSSKSEGAELGFDKTMMMSSPVQTPKVDNPMAHQAEETRSPNNIERIAKTMMMSSPVQTPKVDDPIVQQAEETRSPNNIERIAKTMMMSSPTQTPKTDDSLEQPTKEDLVAKAETESPPPKDPSMGTQTAEASAMDIKPPEAPAPVQLKSGPLFEKAKKSPVTDSKTPPKNAAAAPHSKTPLNNSPKPHKDIDPTFQTPKKIWLMITVVLGFMLALSLAANGYLWFALSNAEQERTGVPGKSGDTSVQTAAAVTAVTGSASGSLKQAANDKQSSAAPQQQNNTAKTGKAEARKDNQKKPESASPKPTPREAKSKTKLSAIKAGFGRLIVKAQGAKSRNIRVSVNTVFRGNAPLELELEPGKYDLNFSRKGQRSFKRVVVRAGETVEVTAKVPKP